MGITFTVYTEASNIDQAWLFDVIPRVVSTQEWERISRADSAAHRPQPLHRRRLRRRPGRGRWRVPSRTAVVVVRTSALSAGGRGHARVYGPTSAAATSCADADGTMYVLEDNLRVPSGVSYMLENRLVTKRVFADLFPDLDIQPVDGYTTKLASLLAGLSPRPGETPVIVVLTPGIFNSAYFEHAFLAQQNGTHLVEGKDLLVVGDDCVYMRTIGGLVRVDVIYRRVDNLFLDPEVFRPDSTLGVPGLMRAWRAGNVAIANAPGAGVADYKVVYADLPALIRYYLGEDPAIPNVPTWLCHLESERRHVLSPSRPDGGEARQRVGWSWCLHRFGRDLAAKEDIRRRVEANPRDYIAQPIVRLSTAPTLCEGRVVPRHLDLRPFILSGPEPYVTPGGLARVALKRGISCRQQFPRWGQQGHLGHRPYRRAGSASVAVVTGEASMLLSRVAESVYWPPVTSAGRATARLVHVHTELFLDLPKAAGLGWTPLSAVTGSGQAFHHRHTVASEEEVVDFLAVSAEHQGSIVASVAQAHANLRVTQAILPNEAWGVLNQLHLWAAETRHEAVDRRTRLAWTAQLIRQCQLFSGLLEGTLSHDDTYAFLEIGRGLERADMTTRVLDVQAGSLVGQSDGASPYADLMWMGVLRSLSAHQMFRRIVGPMVSGPVALRFLLRDPQFPRSVERCLIESHAPC